MVTRIWSLEFLFALNKRESYPLPPNASTRMNSDPLSTALKEIIETKELLESLLTSSESFDYLKAKAALKELNRKVRELAKVRAQFEALQKAAQPNIYVVDFKAPAPAPPEP